MFPGCASRWCPSFPPQWCSLRPPVMPRLSAPVVFAAPPGDALAFPPECLSAPPGLLLRPRASSALALLLLLPSSFCSSPPPSSPASFCPPLCAYFLPRCFEAGGGAGAFGWGKHLLPPSAPTFFPGLRGGRRHRRVRLRSRRISPSGASTSFPGAYPWWNGREGCCCGWRSDRPDAS